MKLPVVAAYFPSRHHRYFAKHNTDSFHSVDALFGKAPQAWQSARTKPVYLLAGTPRFISNVFNNTFCDPSASLACVEHPPRLDRHRLRRGQQAGKRVLESFGMAVEKFLHAHFGGATSASHLVGFGSLYEALAPPSSCVYRGLKHFMNTALGLNDREFFRGGLPGVHLKQPIPQEPADSTIVCYVQKFVHYDGLFPVDDPTTPVLCPSVFIPRAQSYWIARPLSVKELLRVYGVPQDFDAFFVRSFRSIARPLPFEGAMSVDVVSALLRQLWGRTRGGEEVEGVSCDHDPVLATGVQGDSRDQDYSDLSLISEVGREVIIEEEFKDNVVEVDNIVEEIQSDSKEDKVEDRRDIVIVMQENDVVKENHVDTDVVRTDVVETETNEVGVNEKGFQVGDLVIVEHLHRRCLGQIYTRDDGKRRYKIVIKFADKALGLEGPSDCVSKSFDDNIFPDWSGPELAVRPEAKLGLFVDKVEEPSVVSLSESPMFVIPQSSVDSIAEDKKFSKAVKSDDAEVPVHLWNDRLFNTKVNSNNTASSSEPSRVNAANKLRELGLRMYRRSLRKDCLTRVNTRFGKGWQTAPRHKPDGTLTELGIELHALTNILWYAGEATWFEHKSGSTLHYFRFPPIYQKIAKDGVPIFFEKKGPASMKRQARFANPALKKGAQEKINKALGRKYIVEANITLKSLIKYFAVPKGLEDIRMVYDATANGLNDAVWAPSFWLPTVESMLRALTPTSFMLDRDIGEQFHNFPLHPSAWPYTGLDLGPILDEDSEGDDHSVVTKGRWYHWARCLMGFKPSPYNAVKMTLITEEIVRGDRFDEENPFHYTSVELNLPGMVDYDPTKSWLYKLRQDGREACDLFTFVDDERVVGPDKDLVCKAGHRLASIQAYLGIQDAARKLREVSQTPGAWAGSVVHILSEHGVCVLTSPEKWEKLRGILKKWLTLIKEGEEKLDHKELLSDRGFLVYVSKTYPAMIPYLKGFHLTIEMWRDNRDRDGWKMTEIQTPRSSNLRTISEIEDCSEEKEDCSDLLDTLDEEDNICDLDDTAVQHKLRDTGASKHFHMAPPNGYTRPAPRFLSDLEALTALSDSPSPPLRIVRGKVIFAAVYGFGDASGKGFGFTSDDGSGNVRYRIGTWGRDAEDESSNYRELRNLVEAAEEEAKSGKLTSTEFFIFTDNSTAESSFYRGGSSSKLLHELVLRLRLLEIKYSVIIHLVHVSGTRMIAQGTDGTSRGSLLEGVMTGESMLTFVDLAKTAFERQGQTLLNWIREWTQLDDLVPLTPEEWFVEGHGIIGGELNDHGIWMPKHEGRFCTHLWAPPPAVAEVALEELLKARHKRTDTYHIVVIPRLFTPRWRRLFNKACDFTFAVPPNHAFWTADMFEPLWVGIVLPFTYHRPWQLKRAPLLVDMARELREVLRDGDSDGRHILLQLLKLNKRLAPLSKGVARAVLRMPR
mmetsp:Transcript_11711/g.19385  ORF Transcript_11711/g.19385 Transcript_11711/m.19385 type:complete len:1450 (-) Transcript_11711:1434-5783(-)